MREKKKKRRPQVIERVSRTVFKGVLSSEFIAFTPRSVLLKNRPVIFILGRVASMIVHQPDKWKHREVCVSPQRPKL